MDRSRRELRGEKLSKECYAANTMREFNGDNICFGLHGDGYHIPEDVTIDMCKHCGAFEMNWNEWFNKQKDVLNV